MDFRKHKHWELEKICVFWRSPQWIRVSVQWGRPVSWHVSGLSACIGHTKGVDISLPYPTSSGFQGKPRLQDIKTQHSSKTKTDCPFERKPLTDVRRPSLPRNRGVKRPEGSVLPTPLPLHTLGPDWSTSEGGEQKSKGVPTRVLVWTLLDSGTAPKISYSDPLSPRKKTTKTRALFIRISTDINMRNVVVTTSWSGPLQSLVDSVGRNHETNPTHGRGNHHCT